MAAIAPTTAGEVDELYLKASATAASIRTQLPENLRNPKLGIICGSGLGGLANTLDKSLDYFELSYEKIDGFPVSRVPGHAGKLAFGFLGDRKTPVVIMAGRAHFYEGHSIQTATFPVRVLKLLDIKALIVTNAAGGLHPDFNVGDIMIINDHLNMPGIAGNHPLRGTNSNTFGPRFPPLSDAYDLHFRRLAHKAFKTLQSKQNLDPAKKRNIREGVYAFLSGPTFETRAECRMMRMLGADVVGMSTVPEICVARHMGLKVLAFSLVTNCCTLEAVPRGDSEEWEGKTEQELVDMMEEGKANHAEVLEAGDAAARDLQDLVAIWTDEVFGGNV